MSRTMAERDVVLASADPFLRDPLRRTLSSMRWSVREANGGAQALAQLEERVPEALLVDGWLPDLEVGAFTHEVRQLYPQIDLLRFDGTGEREKSRSVYRAELLYALREAMRECIANQPPQSAHAVASTTGTGLASIAEARLERCLRSERSDSVQSFEHDADRAGFVVLPVEPVSLLPGLVGQGASMAELARLIRLVAPHNARVLIQGQTGTGKELVAKAIHALSDRSKKALVVLNCAAIPEALLEAELFGHTRGAFTGAVQSRVGRIEAAHGGTLFLDEIGEMPLALQAKLLRFLENGELQRIGGNETVRVDVRVLAATHQHLEERVHQGTFRLDLFHRLAVFPIVVPSLQERIEDIPALVEHFLAQFGSERPRKRLGDAAIEKLESHTWPGNIRELANVLQRAFILAGTQPEITSSEIVFSQSLR